MNDRVDPAYLQLFWSVLVAAVVALLAIGSFRAKVATKADLESSEDNQEALLRKSLYREDGTTVYTPRVECEKSQTSCANRVCGKLDEMRADNQRRHEEDLATQRIHLQAHSEIAEFVGSVKQFMQQRKEG
jgi:hypothetical protein